MPSDSKEKTGARSDEVDPNRGLHDSDLALFLARAEVRLSTQQRIAGAFISGAGLLILLPVLFKDAAIRIFVSLVGMLEENLGYPALPSFFGNNFESIHVSGFVGFLLLLTFVVSLAIPVLSLWFLLKDLIRFYFVRNFPEHKKHINIVMRTILYR